MRYDTSIPFHGDSEKAMKLAADALTSSNFRIDAFSGNQLRFTGPGMNSNRENPLRGFSTGEISISAGSITFRGEMGAIQKFRLFLTLFIAGMALFFVILFGVILRHKIAPQAKYIAPLPLAPWIVLIPLFARQTRKRAEKAIDTLLNNMAQMAR